LVCLYFDWLLLFPVRAHAFLGAKPKKRISAPSSFIQDTAGDFFPQQGGFDFGFVFALVLGFIFGLTW